MQIPNKIKVGYKDYEVLKVESLDDGTNLLYGEVIYDKEQIKISKNYCDNQQKCTLIHEVLHAIDNMNNIGLEEEQVIKLGKGIYQLIKDNPSMFIEGYKKEGE